MNATLLMQVKEQILRQPERFIMHSWIIKDYDGDYLETELRYDISQCGTTACIGGWTCLLSGVNNSNKAARYVAQELLGIDDYQAEHLFYLSDWDEDLRNRWYAARSKQERAAVAAEHIDRFVDGSCPNFRKTYEEEKRNEQNLAA